MRRALATLAFAALLGTGALSLGSLSGGSRPAAAPAEASFLIPDGEGYGVAECLATGAPCGQAVADAWCEAQGYARAARYGKAAAADVTGAAAPAGSPVAVTCAP